MRKTHYLIGLLASGFVAAQEGIYVDEGACPGEGCRYGERWIATEPVALLVAPDSSAESIATLQKGQSVETLTGEVHSDPGRFEVHRRHGDFIPGDEVLLYTYLGEGWFRLRHNGQIKVIELNFSPWGGSAGTRCDDQERCWGSLQEELEFDWWVKVRTENGEEGWIVDPSDFQMPSYH